MESKKKQVALYLTEAMVKQAKLICIEKGITRVNDFYLQAIAEKIERDGFKASNGFGVWNQ